jgi:hypothetical protein
MRLNIPRGYTMTDAEQAAWITKVEGLTRAYHNKAPAVDVSPFQADTYRQFSAQVDVSPFITEMWKEFLDHAEKLYVEGRRDFLQDPLMQWAIFLSAGGKWQEVQIPFLESRWQRDELQRLLREDHPLTPSITSEEYHCSETIVNHLTHLTTFADKTGVTLASDLKCTVEFGGGCGSMGRLLRRLRPDATHVTVDLPVFLFLQKYFLENIFGPDSVNLVWRDTGEIQPHKINLVAIGNDRILNGLSSLRPDLFIATWSLSETNQYTQDYVRERDYFGAAHTLIGYRHYEEGKPNPKQPCSDAIELTSAYQTVFRGPTFFSGMDEQHYWFARRSH